MIVLMTGGKLKGVNMVSFVALSMISIRLVILPGDVIQYAKNDAWISVLITAIVSYLSAYIAYYTASKNPGYNFAQVNSKIFGRMFGKTFIIMFTGYIIFTAGLSLRLFSDSIKMFLLDTTPSIVVEGLMLFACSYCLIKGIKTISIVFDLMLPVVFFIVIISLITYKNAELKNLLPIAHYGIKPILKGSFYIIDSAIGCGIASYVMPYFENTKDTKKWIFIGVTIAITVYLMLILMCILTFGVIEVQHLTFPGILLAKIIEFKAEIFERAESFFMAAWIPAVFANLVVLGIVASLNIKEIFSTKRTNIIVFILSLLILIVSLIPKSIVEVYKYLTYNSIIAAFINLIYIPIYFTVVVLKGSGKKKYEK